MEDVRLLYYKLKGKSIPLKRLYMTVNQIVQRHVRSSSQGTDLTTLNKYDQMSMLTASLNKLRRGLRTSESILSFRHACERCDVQCRGVVLKHKLLNIMRMHGIGVQSQEFNVLCHQYEQNRKVAQLQYDQLHQQQWIDYETLLKDTLPSAIMKRKEHLVLKDLPNNDKNNNNNNNNTSPSSPSSFGRSSAATLNDDNVLSKLRAIYKYARFNKNMNVRRLFEREDNSGGYSTLNAAAFRRCIEKMNKSPRQSHSSLPSSFVPASLSSQEWQYVCRMYATHKTETNNNYNNHNNHNNHNNDDVLLYMKYLQDMEETVDHKYDRHHTSDYRSLALRNSSNNSTKHSTRTLRREPHRDLKLRLKNKLRHVAASRGNHSLKHREYFDLRKPFEQYDTLHTGFVTKNNFKQGLCDLGLTVDNAELSYLMHSFHTNNSRRGNIGISYSSFCKFVDFDEKEMDEVSVEIGNRLVAVEDEGALDWRDTFRLFDHNENGFICKREFKECVRRIGLPINEGALYALMSRFEHFNKTDQVGWTECIAFLNNRRKGVLERKDRHFISSSDAEEEDREREELRIRKQQKRIQNQDPSTMLYVNGNGYDGIRAAATAPSSSLSTSDATPSHVMGVPATAVVNWLNDKASHDDRT